MEVVVVFVGVFNVVVVVELVGVFNAEVGSVGFVNFGFGVEFDVSQC